MVAQPSILLTGATGLLGTSCLSHLALRHGPGQIVALVRRGRSLSPFVSSGVTTTEGDITKPDLGLTRADCQTLCSSVRLIIHCAADIRFNISLEESRRTNTQGTENLLRFAGRCIRLERFAHVSTVYVFGGRTGHILEEPADPGPFLNSYQHSKFEAEQAVLRAMRDLPATIYRFSTMIYDELAGRVEQFNYFHQLLRLAQANPLDMIPADPHAPVDLVTSDWAACVFDRLFEEHFHPGEIVHICAGREHSLTVGELVEITFGCLAAESCRPRIVDQQYFDHHVSAILKTASRRQMWQSLSRFLPQMNVSQTFAAAKLHARLGREGLEPPCMRSVLPKVLSYCLASNWRVNDLAPIN
jgi:nucleoside-diphosphate-sugar epimerase